jgi:pimeloyl-ACP methyl ester carboxylesterase
MGDHRNYDLTIPYLDVNNFTYIFVDHRGYGLSKEIQGEYSCDEAAYDIKDLIDYLKLDEVILLAHSMSTMIAQKIALIEKKIKKLILITPISASGVKMAPSAKERLLNDMVEDKNKLEEIVEGSSKRYNQKWRDYRIDIAYSSSTLEARVGYMNMYLNTDFAHELNFLNIPVKIIVGRHDLPVFTKANVQKIFSSHFTDLEILECQEAGHYPMIECPVYFATEVEKFCK